jgi:hypothetical protein
MVRKKFSEIRLPVPRRLQGTRRRPRSLRVSLASRSLGFKYKSLIFGSWPLCAIVGYFVGHGADLWSCAFAGGVVGLVDATLGRAVSWWIGPGRPTAELSASAAVSIVLIVALSGAAFGWSGGVVSRLL